MSRLKPSGSLRFLHAVQSLFLLPRLSPVPHAHIPLLSLRSVCVLSAASSRLVGSSGLEPPTSRLSGVRSNHLSYEPMSAAELLASCLRPALFCASDFPPLRLRTRFDFRLALYAFCLRLLVPRAARFDSSLSFVRDLPPAQLVVEMNGFEPMTPCLQSRCSPS